MNFDGKRKSCNDAASREADEDANWDEQKEKALD